MRSDAARVFRPRTVRDDYDRGTACLLTLAFAERDGRIKTLVATDQTEARKILHLGHNELPTECYDRGATAYMVKPHEGLKDIVNAASASTQVTKCGE